ncbi:MAG: dimethylsulfonioproprionate lyase family protein [Paracoccaceae bacterium]|nr:dimethylsulfonioproprionate lyase family protein [Paracoccaceae bacterium]
MSDMKPYQNAEKLLIWLSSKLQADENKLLELTQFIQELDDINYSFFHQIDQITNPPELVSALKKNIFLNSYATQIGSLNIDNILDFDWKHVYQEEDSKNSYINGMFVSRLLGLDGYYRSDRIAFGLMLLLPGVLYPLHTHLVQEFYYCLSGKLVIQHDFDGQSFSLDEGQISVTPEGKLHSLEVVGKNPVLLIYSWLGNLRAPIRIWEKTKSDKWEGFVWTRLPGQKWITSDKKELSDECFKKLYSKYSQNLNM